MGIFGNRKAKPDKAATQLIPAIKKLTTEAVNLAFGVDRGDVPEADALAQLVRTIGEIHPDAPASVQKTLAEMAASPAEDPALRLGYGWAAELVRAAREQAAPTAEPAASDES